MPSRNEARRLPQAETRDARAGATRIDFDTLATRDWHWCEGTWDAARFRPRILDQKEVPYGGFVLATSPPMHLAAGKLQIFDFDLTATPDAALLRFQVVDLSKRGRRRALAWRDVEVGSTARSGLACCPGPGGPFVLQLTALGEWADLAPRYRPQVDLVITGFVVRHGTLAAASGPDHPSGAVATDLPHWNGFERWVHRRCKRSRRVNGVVSALETRLGREELLSLPQYMSLCPTGQCNATCGFCSVTVARTGIIKRQLPLADIRSFTAPVAKTVHLFGLEGNGEPTLYRDFERLLEHVLGQGATAYLITNASQFRPELLPLLLGLSSINVSLNAATAETHLRVMGLRNFAVIVDGIRELMRRRGPGRQAPQVSVSFVVTRQNVFEAVDCLRFAEFDLKVDRILLRPLSELGNDGGAVEDFRDLVPFQSEVDDLIESVNDYLTATQERRRAEIVFEPNTFRAVRPDPPGTGVLPLDRPHALPAPRRGHWRAEHDADIVWESASRFLAKRPARSEAGTFLVSGLIPVPPVRQLMLEMTLTGTAEDFEVRALDCAGAVIASEMVTLEPASSAHVLQLTLSTEATSAVAIEMRHGAGAFAIAVDLGRVRRPAPIASPYPAVPEPARWEETMVGAQINWVGSTQTIHWNGAPALYLAKSYSRPCLPGVTLRYPLRICVRSGALGIGILSEDFQSWVKTFRFEAGDHAATLEIDVGSNARIQVVVYACERGLLDAQIDWTEAMRQPPIPVLDLDRLAARARAFALESTSAKHAVPTAPDKGARRSAIAAAKATVAATPAAADNGTPARLAPRPRPSRGGSLRRLFHDPRTIYCHKPWTDLHNFTVDGRMDVCCIATGASQTRFALGNMREASFQQVWNGPTAREFRRTVNDPAKALPPCQRCPMAHNYAGPLFNPDLTFLSVWDRLQRVPLPLPLPMALPLPLARAGRWLLRATFLIVYGPIHLWIFRGFRRPSLFPPFEHRRERA